VKVRKILFGTSLALILVIGAASQGYSQAQPVQNRIPQPIMINGQSANGAYVQTAAGGMQSYKCPNPQAYNTPDGASSGWACYDQSTATYLLNALPPAPPQTQQVQAQPQPQTLPDPATGQQAQVQVQQQPTVIYQQPNPAVVYAPAPYPYYYPYYGPSLYFGVGFGPRFIGPGFYGGFGGFRGGGRRR